MRRGTDELSGVQALERKHQLCRFARGALWVLPVWTALLILGALTFRRGVCAEVEDELIRTMGLASVWTAVGVLGVILGRLPWQSSDRYEDSQGRFTMEVGSWEQVETDASYPHFKLADPPMHLYVLVLGAQTIDEAFSQAFQVVGFDPAVLAGGAVATLGDWQRYSHEDTAGLAYGLAGQIVGENAYVYMVKADQPGIGIENAAVMHALASMNIAGKDEIDETAFKSYADRSEIIALGNVISLRMEENQHLAQFDITVVPEYRLQGLGRRLLSRIAKIVEQEKRRLLMTSTIDRIPAGAAFMMRIGAQKALEAHTNQLRIADLDGDLICNWLARGQKNLTDFELGFWDGVYPEDQLQAIAALRDLTNQQPLGDLEIEDMHMTPEHLRQLEQNIFARGNQRWTFYILDRANGKFAGYTETIWNPNRPEILLQEMTGVFPHYRSRGLGRWLKAAMLEKVLKDCPQVRYVRTVNADSNAAMLKINTELGFKPYTADTLWQVELRKVLDYLASHNEE